MRKLILFIILATGIFQLSAQVPRKVFLEELTATWCGNCPNGMTIAEKINNTYRDDVITVTEHCCSLDSTAGGYDPMTNNYSANTIYYFNNGQGIPCALFDRYDWSGSVSYHDTDWAARCADRLAITSPLGIDLVSTYNQDTRAASITVNVFFADTASGDIRISCLLVEDSVTGGGGYNQENYMGKGCPAADTTSEWYSYPCVIHTSDTGQVFTHRNVIRLNLSPVWGTAGVIPQSGVTAGQKFSKTYQCVIPPSTPWNLSHLKVIALVSHYSTDSLHRVDSLHCDILNAQKVTLGDSITGIHEYPSALELADLETAPNPFSMFTQIKVKLPVAQHVSVSLYDLLGNEITMLANNTYSPGVHTLYWNGTNAAGIPVPNGLYLVRLQTGKQSLARSVVLLRN